MIKNSQSKILRVTLRSRISQSDVHYGDGIVSAAKVMELFGDAATELLIRLDKNEGLLRAYKDVEFLAPVKAGDFLEVSAALIQKGHTSRQISFEAYKVIEGTTGSKARVLNQPVLVAKAMGTCVVK